MVSYDAYVYEMSSETYLVDITGVYAGVISRDTIESDALVGDITFDSALCLAVEISLTDDYEFVTKGQWKLPNRRVCRKYAILIGTND